VFQRGAQTTNSMGKKAAAEPVKGPEKAKVAVPTPPKPPETAKKSLSKGEALPPVGTGPFMSGFFAMVFFLFPAVLTLLLEPVVKPEEKLKALVGSMVDDPIAAPIFAAIFHLFVLQWLAMCVNGARVKFNVAWPTLYVESTHVNATAYNCAQRAHQHVLEQTHTLLVLLLIASLDFPLTAGVASALFSFSKIVGNVFGYSSGDAKKKDRGAFGYLGLLSLFGLSMLVGLRRAGHADRVTTHVEAAYNQSAAVIGPYVMPYVEVAMAKVKGALSEASK